MRRAAGVTQVNTDLCKVTLLITSQIPRVNSFVEEDINLSEYGFG